MSDSFSTTGILLGDRTRATMLLGLMGGIALPAGELARIANVAPQTASEHLAKLVSGRLLTVERQGRHRYYRLSSAQVPGRDRIEDRGSIPQNGDFALFDAMSPVSSVKRYIAGSATTSGRHALAAWFAHGDFASIASHSWRHRRF